MGLSSFHWMSPIYSDSCQYVLYATIGARSDVRARAGTRPTSRLVDKTVLTRIVIAFADHVTGIIDPADLITLSASDMKWSHYTSRVGKSRYLAESVQIDANHRPHDVDVYQRTLGRFGNNECAVPIGRVHHRPDFLIGGIELKYADVGFAVRSENHRVGAARIVDRGEVINLRGGYSIRA